MFPTSPKADPAILSFQTSNSKTSRNPSKIPQEAELTPFQDASAILAGKPGSLSQIYYVTPRNISPWSSKATSIAHVCGLKTQVHRIERGRAILVNFAEPFDGRDATFKDVL